MSRFIQTGAEEKAPKEEKKEVPVKAGTKDYDYADLGKNKPMLGGNYNA